VVLLVTLVLEKTSHYILLKRGALTSLSPTATHHIKVNGSQGRIQEFKKGGSFKIVRAERAEKFWVTTPTFAKPRPF